MELWDAYNSDETLAGRDLVRGEKIPMGLKHAVAEVLVLHRDGSMLVTQRAFSKPNYPGMYEASAGGAVQKGETMLQGARRELWEETGIEMAEESLTDTYRVVTDHVIYRGYVCTTDIPKDMIILQEEETISYRWLEREEFLSFFQSEQYVSTLRERQRELVEKILT